MSRYVREIELNLSAEDVEGEIAAFLQRDGFYPTEWKGQSCFCADMFGADDGLFKNLKAYYFFCYAYENGTLHMEAWIRDGKTKEADLRGMVGYTAKQPYLQRLVGLEAHLIGKMPRDSRLYQENLASVNNVVKTSNKTGIWFGILIAVLMLILMIGNMKFR